LAQRVSDEDVAPNIHYFLYTPRSFTDLLRELTGFERLFLEVVVLETIQPGAIEFCRTVRELSVHVKDRAAPVPVADSNVGVAAPAALRAVVVDIPALIRANAAIALFLR
jgi:hypothetical protein